MREHVTPERRIVPHPTDPTACLVELTRGQWATIDAADADLVRPYRWQACRVYKGWYAGAGTATGFVLMHRLIAATPIDMETDHIDRDKLNNRRSNLRHATGSQNQINRDLRPGRSGFRGVTGPSCHFWQASIRVNGKHTYLGRFATPEEAARAYDAAARQHHGAFAVTNFSEETH